MNAALCLADLSGGSASLHVRELVHPLEKVAAFQARREWSRGRVMEVLPRSRPGQIGMTASDHHARHFGIYSGTRMVAYARCIPVSTVHGTAGAATRNPWKMDQLHLHPQWSAPSELRLQLLKILCMPPPART